MRVGMPSRAPMMSAGMHLISRGNAFDPTMGRPYIPRRLRGVDIEAEYALIQQKKCKLPAITRAMVVRVCEIMEENRKGE